MMPFWLYLFLTTCAGGDQRAEAAGSGGQVAARRLTTVDHGMRFSREQLQRLPTARNLWVVLESQQAGVVTDRIDIGGLKSGVPARFGGHGTSWTQNVYRLDGLDLTDPYSGDQPLFYPDFDALEALEVSTAAHSAAVGAPGVALSLVPRQGGDASQGTAQLYYQGDRTQGDDVPPAKRRLGVRSPEHFRSFLSGGLQLEGPLLQKRARFFLSLSAQDFSKYPHDVSRPADTTLVSAFSNLTWTISRHRLGLLWTGQVLNNPHLGASARVPPESTLDQTRRYNVAQVRDDVTLTSSLALEARLGYAHATTDNRLQGDSLPQSGLELFHGFRSGAAPLLEEAARTRASFAAAIRGSSDFRAPAGLERPLRLEYRAGLAWEEAWSASEFDAVDDLNLAFFGGEPFAVLLLNTPSATRQRLRHLSLFAESRSEWPGRLALALGLRLQASSGWLRRGEDRALEWTILSPRAGLVVPIGGRLAFRASYARYAHQLLGSHLDFQDPMALSGRRVRWHDVNGDRQFQTGEEGGVLRTFGGLYSSVDPALEPPVTREVVVGADLHAGRGIDVSVTAFDRYESRLLETVNTGVPFSSFSPVRLVDRGGDDVAGTADDRVVTVYEQSRETLGRDRYLLTNPPGFRDSYQGVEVVARSRDAAARLFVQVSAAAFKIVGMASQDDESQEYDQGVVGRLFDDPNTLLEADNRLFFDRAYLGKVALAYRLPWGLEAGCVAKYYDGLPFGRKLIVAGLNQGPFYVFGTPRGNRNVGLNGHRVEYNATLDAGLEKRVALGRRLLRLRLDGFNVLNATNNVRESDVGGPSFNTRVPLEIQAPRVFRLGLRYEF